MRIRSCWHTGAAHLLPDDAPVARMRPQLNSAAVWVLG
ncbi:hypothetical protein QF026_008588 [Streptomyces aurantiacus]|nr:hypothetical protein [Streptomyces aurantiacus]